MANYVKTNIAAGVVIKKGDKYLLVQEKKAHVFGLWNFPAGKVEVGDTIEQTAIKEAKEETGLVVKLVRKLGIFQEDSSEPAKHAFEAKIVSGELMIPKNEILDAQWFSFKEILAMRNKLRNEWIINAIHALEKK